MTIIARPFERIALDIVGSFPRSNAGYQYVPVILNYATRFPEAIPLKTITACKVAEELFVDICYTSTVVPKMLVNLLAKHKTSSVNACFTQMFFLLLSGTCELVILSVMAYDHYAAICNPLHYGGTMNKKVCRQLVGVSWTISLMHSLVNTVPVLKLQFCGPSEIGHFSYELPSLIKLSCTGTIMSNVALFSSAVIIGAGSFILMLMSYVHIISTIFSMCSSEGRCKAFSTCSSHLIVVGLLYGTVVFQYLKPRSFSSVILDQVVSIQYSILTPMLNPIICRLKKKAPSPHATLLKQDGNCFHLQDTEEK
ncbi:olfactory receptor 5V1-like [Alligator sinensis]|uniref:Olfactory receptor 5V1-like n=1 Tax=Alligator sinensis TaxID=38654 RepID=A0A1U8DD13_ALLSI|nr:olfactory receptor 5V1-like [Alligator sinensis]